MIKILTTCEIAELHTDIPCMDFKLDKVRWIKVEDVKSLIESVYNKYVVPDNVNGVNTEHVVIGGVRFKTLVNHPISAMRAELLEQLEANQTKDLPETKQTQTHKQPNLARNANRRLPTRKRRR